MVSVHIETWARERLQGSCTKAHLALFRAASEMLERECFLDE